jgi:hypothetical protein
MVALWLPIITADTVFRSTGTTVRDEAWTESNTWKEQGGPQAPLSLPLPSRYTANLTTWMIRQILFLKRQLGTLIG